MKQIKIFLVLLSLLGSSSAYAEKVSLMLDWFVNPDHGNVIIAQQMGFFKEQGLDVDILEPADPADPPKFSALKKVDYAMNYQNTLQIQATEGWKNVRVASMITSPLTSLIVLKESGITSISQLKGKKIGYSAPGFENVTIGTMLRANGLDLTDVTLINVNWALASSLLTKQVDAVVGGYRNFELTQLELEGRPGIAFFPEDHGMPMYDEIVLVTHRDNARSETTKKMVIALERAVRYMKNHPKKSWEKFKAYKPSLLDNELNKRAWFDTMRRFTSTPSALDHGRYYVFAKFLEDNKMVTKKVPALENYAIDIFAK